jgi:predicted HAD superfamily Cof-like phosphohydrolase
MSDDDIGLPYGDIHLVSASERDRWIRLFNRLDAAISHHERDDRFRDDHDEALYAARRRVLKDAGKRSRTHEVQRDVADFHREVCGIEDSTTPAIRRPDLRANLIMEEAVETCEASTGRRIEWRYVDDEPVAEPDLVGAIDGICDLLCVTYGTALEYGIDVAPFWDAVHASNMAKAGGPVRDDGKRLKPEGWSGPDIAGVMEAEYGGVGRS